MDFERAYKKQKVDNAQSKQALDMQLDRERERTAELKIAEDISQLLTTGKWSDVTISVGGKDFAVHKGILSTRSSIFADLLEKNRKENCLVINDVDVDVFEILLSFIYTGKVPALEAKMAHDLLAASEKYKLDQLKSIAEDYLCGQLSLGSVASHLQFAEAVNATKLKDKCMELLNSPASPSTTPRPLLPIVRLHDPCLVALFRQLPPADQITARTVCRRWADLVPYAARSTRSLAILVDRSQDKAEDQLNRLSHGRDWRLLKLLKKEDGTPLLPMHSLSQWNSLQLSPLDERTITQIMATFPVLKELQLSARLYINYACCTATKPPLPSLDHLVHLLEHWRPQLTTLKLGIWSSSEAALSCYRLGAAISSLPALKYLYLDLYWNSEPHCPHLSNLHQLSHFTANSIQSVYMLRQYDPLNPALVQISYDSGGNNDYDSIIPLLTSLDENLRRRFLRIDTRYIADYHTVCPHFPSLTSVNFALTEVTFRDFLTSASHLTQLINLKLHIDFSVIRPDDQPQHLLPQLKSVKLLHLGITNRKSHRDLEPLNLPWTMPNVQVIDFILRHLRCSTCGISFLSVSKRKRKHCFRQMLHPLKRDCAQLHTIKHDQEYWLGTAEELLAEEPITEAASSSIDTESIDVVSAD